MRPSQLRLAYNTNGLAHHRPEDSLAMLAELGYAGVALTPDVGCLDPMADFRDQARSLRAQAADLGLTLTVETGARFVLDPWVKHAPNLMDASAAGRERRLDFYRRSIELCVELGAPLLSLWSGGALDGSTWREGDPLLRERLVEGLRVVLESAEGAGVRVAFEPEPGMFVERPSEYGELRESLEGVGGGLGLTLDVGHLAVTGDQPEAAVIRAFADDLLHVHLDDCPKGVHEHRMFGEGDVDLHGVLGALAEVEFQGLAAVELSRDSHRGPEVAERALLALQAASHAIEDRIRGSEAGSALPPPK